MTIAVNMDAVNYCVSGKTAWQNIVVVVVVVGLEQHFPIPKIISSDPEKLVHMTKFTGHKKLNKETVFSQHNYLLL